MNYAQRNTQISIFLSIFTITLIIAFWFLLRPDTMPQLQSFSGIIHAEHKSYYSSSTINLPGKVSKIRTTPSFSVNVSSGNSSDSPFQTALVEKMTPVKVMNFSTPQNAGRNEMANQLAYNTVGNSPDFELKTAKSIYKSDIANSDLLQNASMTVQAAPVLPGSMTEPTADYTAPLGNGFWILMAYVTIYALYKLRKKRKLVKN